MAIPIIAGGIFWVLASGGLFGVLLRRAAVLPSVPPRVVSQAPTGLPVDDPALREDREVEDLEELWALPACSRSGRSEC